MDSTTNSEHKLFSKSVLDNVLRKTFVGDKVIWAILFSLIITSLLCIYSSSLSLAWANKSGNFNYYLFNQIRIILVGFFILIILRCIPISFYKKFAWKLFWVSIALLVFTYAKGAALNSAKRWLVVFGYSIQTSEFVKIGLIILLSYIMSSWSSRIDHLIIVPFKELVNYKSQSHKAMSILKNYTLKILGPIALSCLMIIPANLSTGLVLGAISLLFLIIGRIAFKEIGKIVVVAITVLTIFLIIVSVFNIGRDGTWGNRMKSFVGIEVKTESGEMSLVDQQRLQSDIAIANGWLLGMGGGNSVQRSNLSNANSDFIYSFILEEWGILGGGFVLFLYLWLFYRSIQIARKCEDEFATLLCSGLGLLYCCSAMAHIGVCVGFMPVTGLTLPLVSHGGTSIVFSFIVFGMILRISYEQELDEKLKELQLRENTNQNSNEIINS